MQPLSSLIGLKKPILKALRQAAWGIDLPSVRGVNTQQQALPHRTVSDTLIPYCQ